MDEGGELNQRNASRVPTTAPINGRISSTPGMKGMSRYLLQTLLLDIYEITPTNIQQVIRGTVARVSNPSVKLTPLAMTAIARVIKGINSSAGMYGKFLVILRNGTTI